MTLEELLADPACFPALLTLFVFWIVVLLFAIFDPGGFGN